MMSTKPNTAWTDHVHGLGLTQRGNTTPAPVSDALGDIVNGTPDVYAWNGGWGYRNEANTGGLQKVGVRWYDSAVGRFLQKDPWLGSITYPLTLNAYGYCVNEPIGLVDPSGNILAIIGVVVAVAAVIGSAVVIGSRINDLQTDRETKHRMRTIYDEWTTSGGQDPSGRIIDLINRPWDSTIDAAREAAVEGAELQYDLWGETARFERWRVSPPPY